MFSGCYDMTGATGETGPQGNIGSNGLLGKNGSQVFVGIGIPTESTGQPYGTYNGISQYLDSETGAVWWKDIVGWTNVNNIKGPHGIPVNLSHKFLKIETIPINLPPSQWINLGSVFVPITLQNKNPMLGKIFYKFSGTNNSTTSEHVEIRVTNSLSDVILLCRENISGSSYVSILSIDSIVLNTGTESETYYVEIRRSSSDLIINFNTESIITFQLIY